MWKHSLADWELVSLNAYKFIFEQSEKRLNNILEEGEKITNRAYTLLGITIPLASIIVSLLLQSSTKDVLNAQILVPTITIGIVLSVCLFSLIRIIMARDIRYSGTEPRDILLPHYVEIPDLTNEEQLKYLYLSETEQNQYRIDSNKGVNLMRIKIFRRCLIAIILSLSILIALVIIVQYE